ncbi:MAG TPA: hypothetical protein VK453_11835 [Micromonosporaceae bacterium]|nr:hypothetical protein [Micromonosporaceae bacterium]
MSYSSGVIADVHANDDLAVLYESVHDAIRTAGRDAAARYPYADPHLTLA